MMDLLQNLMGINYDKISKFLVEKKNVNKLLAIPKGRTVNVWVIMEAQSELLIRHEGVDDITEFEVKGITVPGILNTKFQAVVRREMLRTLYAFAENKGLSKLYQLATKYKVGGSEKLKEWSCYLVPGAKKSEKKKNEEIMKGGYCTVCPNCMIFGYVSGEQGTYNVKSRVEGDAYFGLCPSKLCVVRRTFNAVNDVTKTTFMGTGPGETGALFSLSLVEPGTVFVGKMALRDLSLSELLLTLYSIAKVERIGGRVTHFGRVKIHIPVITFDYFEKGSGYEIASMLISADSKIGLEEAINKVVEKAKGAVIVAKRDLADKLRELKEEDIFNIVENAWRDSLVFKASIESLIYGE